MLITQNPSVDLLASRLCRIGYKVERSELAGKTYVRFVAPNGRVWLTPAAHLRYPFANAAVAQLASEKDQAYDFVDRQRVNIPTTQVVAGAYQEADFKDILKKAPLIVKPNNASLSNGLTRHIKTYAQLNKALQEALTFSNRALVQEQMYGEEVRFVMLQGKCKAAILRQTPRLIGDGTHSVAQLLAIENQARHQLKLPYITYPQLQPPLIEVPADRLSTIPAKGAVVELSRATMIRDGASIYNITDQIDPSYIHLAESLAQSLGAEFIVADIFIDDYTVPLNRTNYAFIEFNTAPVLKLFYSCRNNNYDILQDLLPMINEAMGISEGRQPLGAFEDVSLPEFGIKNALAKIDSGAYSGALHCKTIELDKSGKQPVLKFTLFHEPGKIFATQDFALRHVRSSTGHRVKRFIVDTTIIIHGETYPIKIGLSDRSKMKYDILLGRRFLREHNFIVDVRLNQEHDVEMERD